MRVGDAVVTLKDQEGLLQTSFAPTTQGWELGFCFVVHVLLHVPEPTGERLIRDSLAKYKNMFFINQSWGGLGTPFPHPQGLTSILILKTKILPKTCVRVVCVRLCVCVCVCVCVWSCKAESRSPTTVKVATGQELPCSDNLNCFDRPINFSWNYLEPNHPRSLQFIAFNWVTRLLFHQQNALQCGRQSSAHWWTGR